MDLFCVTSDLAGTLWMFGRDRLVIMKYMASVCMRTNISVSNTIVA